MGTSLGGLTIFVVKKIVPNSLNVVKDPWVVALTGLFENLSGKGYLH